MRVSPARSWIRNERRCPSVCGWFPSRAVRRANPSPKLSKNSWLGHTLINFACNACTRAPHSEEGAGEAASPSPRLAARPLPTYLASLMTGSWQRLISTALVCGLCMRTGCKNLPHSIYFSRRDEKYFRTSRTCSAFDEAWYKYASYIQESQVITRKYASIFSSDNYNI